MIVVPDDPLGVVRITGREIYDAVVRLTGSVDVMLNRIEGQHSQIHDQEARIRRLEQRQWPMPALAVLVAVLSLAVSVVPRLIEAGT